MNVYFITMATAFIAGGIYFAHEAKRIALHRAQDALAIAAFTALGGAIAMMALSAVWNNHMEIVLNRPPTTTRKKPKRFRSIVEVTDKKRVCTTCGKHAPFQLTISLTSHALENEASALTTPLCAACGTTIMNSATIQASLMIESLQSTHGLRSLPGTDNARAQPLQSLEF